MVGEAGSKPAAVAALGPTRFVEFVFLFLCCFLPLELSAGSRCLEDEGEGAAGLGGGRGGGLGEGFWVGERTGRVSEQERRALRASDGGG